MGFKVISMFSGAGGLDMGFHNKGFDILWANDFDKDACDTYDLWANYHADGTRKKIEERTEIVCGDIAKVDLKSILPGVKIDVILGGFPCQGFSLAGPRQVDDSRNVLYQHFVELVRIKRPKVFVAENVIGIKTLGGGAVFKKILEDFSLLDYTVSAPTINAKNFGVPQDRMRVLFIGIRNDICNGGAYRFPEGNLEVVTLGKALKDLEPVDMNDVCQAPFSSRYMSRNRKRGFDDVSFTIPAMAKQVALSPDSDGMKYVGVDQFEFVGNYNRRLSYKETAAIQTFPKDMVFCGNLDSKYKQIGNAVPVKLAEAIATEVKTILTVEDLRPFLNFENPEDECYGKKSDKRINNTVISGKAFEYATLIEIYNILQEKGWEKSQLEIKDDKNYSSIARAYDIVRGWDEEDESEEDQFHIEIMKNPYNRAARVAASYLYKAEPILQNPKGLYGVLRALPDSAGVHGDVRDIGFTIYSDSEHIEKVGEIGISCKNNHEAVKHPRITEKLDFAFDWTGKYHCSDRFITEMKRIQTMIEDYASRFKRWSEVDEKKETVYYPIMKLFVEEIERLGKIEAGATDHRKEEAKEFARLLFEYMFGNYDFYKIIKDTKTESTKIYPYNMHGSLMNSYQGHKNNQAVKYISLPEEIVEVRMKPGSKTTLEIYFDQWIISMRLHNADAKIRKTSLKFDVQIKAQPRRLNGYILRWEELDC